MSAPTVIGQPCPTARSNLTAAGYAVEVYSATTLESGAACSSEETVIWQSSELTGEDEQPTVRLLTSKGGDDEDEDAILERIKALTKVLPPPTAQLATAFAAGLVIGVLVGVLLF